MKFFILYKEKLLDQVCQHILDPELNAYSVSQYEHLSGQPVNLIKCVGKPDLEVSPCIE